MPAHRFAVTWAVTAALAMGAFAADRPVPTVVTALPHRGDNAQAVAMSPDGKLVAAAFGGPSNGRFPLTPNGGGIAIWETETGNQIRFHGEYGDVLKLEFSPDGQSLAYLRVYTPGDSIDDHVVVLLDVATGDVRKRWSIPDNGNLGNQFAFSPALPHILIGDQVYLLKDFSRVNALPVTGIRCLAVNLKGKRLAAVHQVKFPVIRDDGTVNPNAHHLKMHGLCVFDATTYQKLRGAESPDLVDCFAIAMSPDGQFLATGHTKGTARVWRVDIDALQEVKALHSDSATHVLPVFAPDGRSLIVASQPTNGPRWSYDRNQPSGFQFDRGSPGSRCELSFLETQNWGQTRRWQLEDAAYHTYHARFGKHKLFPEYNSVRVAFSPNGQSVLAACNGVVLVELATGKVLRQYTTAEIRP